MPGSIRAAVRTLETGGLIVYPTDTLFGLGARARDRRAVERLTAAKRRPSGLPISVAVSSYEELEPWAEWTPERRAYARRVLPGAVTLIVPASRRARRELAPGIVGPEGSVGLRIPDHPLAREIARQAGPITCTSANRHGEPPARSLGEARASLGSAVGLYLSGSPPPSGRPSRLADLRGALPRFVERA